MPRKFKKLTREKIKLLEANQVICEHNIQYIKKENGDGLFKIYGTVDGQRINRTVGRESEGVTRQAAEMAWEQLKTQAREKRLNLPKGRKNHFRFSEAANYYLERIDRSKSYDKKQQQIRDYLLPYFKNKALNQLTPFDGEQYKRWRTEADASPATINRELALMSHILNKSVEWGFIDKVPCKFKKLKESEGRMVYLTVEQAAMLIKMAKLDIHPYIYPIIRVALETAMRRAEILSIRLEHIDIDRCIIYIPDAKAGAREQPITESLAQYLKGFIKMIPQYQPWLFPAKNTKDGHTVEIFKPFKRVVAAAGLDPSQIVLHSLRHTAITHLVQAGVDLMTVKRISGHKTLKMVERYSHQNGQHIQTAMSKLEQRYGSEAF